MINNSSSLFNFSGSKIIALLGLGLLLLLSACHEEFEPATLQVIHASPDSPALEIKDDGFLFSDGLVYYGSTSQVDLGAGLHDVAARGILASGSRPALFSISQRDFEAGTNTVVVAINKYAAIESYVFVQDSAETPETSARVRIAHLAPDAPMVDVYVTAVDADLTTEAALTTQSFRGELANVMLDAGQYQIRLTPVDSQTVIFDSGSISITGGQDLSLLVLDTTSVSDSPVEILFLNGTSTSLIRDQNAGSELRIIHASPDSPAVDVAIDDDFDNLAATGLTYSQVLDYVPYAAATYNISVVETGTITPDLIDTDQTLATGSSNSFYVVGLASDETVSGLLASRDQRRIATDAKVEIFHAAPSAGNVDIYLTAVGTDISTIDPLYLNIAFGTSTGIVLTAPNNYELTVTETGTTTVLVDTTTLTFAASGLYTAVVIDDQITTADTDGLPASLLLMDDF